MSDNKYIIDYSAHDIAYKRNKEKGLPGWNNAEDTAEHIELLERILDYSYVPKSGSVLDIGCGAGNISFWLESKGYCVTGIDVSSEAIKWAVEQAELKKSKVEFRVVNAATNNFKTDKKSDMVLDNNCLHCIIGEDRMFYLNNICENLISGGIYICNTMCDEIRDENIRQYFDPQTRLFVRNNLAIRYIGRHEDIIREITSAGFKLLHHESTSCTAQDSMCIIACKVKET